MTCANELAGLIGFVFEAHDQQATEPKKRFRKWDRQTPYAIHPVWCAMTILAETALPEELRTDGAQALLLHDLLEDTTAELPEGVSGRVRELVEEMTFESFEEEAELVWQRSEACQLLKLYDKVSNLLDMNWRTDKREAYKTYTLRLAELAAQRYGELNIVKMAHTIAS